MPDLRRERQGARGRGHEHLRDQLGDAVRGGMWQQVVQVVGDTVVEAVHGDRGGRPLAVERLEPMNAAVPVLTHLLAAMAGGFLAVVAYAVVKVGADSERGEDERERD